MKKPMLNESEVKAFFLAKCKDIGWKSMDDPDCDLVIVTDCNAFPIFLSHTLYIGTMKEAQFLASHLAEELRTKISPIVFCTDRVEKSVQEFGMKIEVNAITFKNAEMSWKSLYSIYNSIKEMH